MYPCPASLGLKAMTRVTARGRDPALPPRALAAGKLTVARILSRPRRLSADPLPILRTAQNAGGTSRHLKRAGRKTARGIATASFPLRSEAAWRTLRPVGLPPPSRRARCLTIGGVARRRARMGRPPVTGHGCRMALAWPGRAHSEAGTRPQRFRRASSVPAFRMPRITADVWCRVTDAAPNQRLARGRSARRGH